MSTIDDNDVNPITGSAWPEYFAIDDDNPLWHALARVRQELPWLKSEDYHFVLSDIQEAIWLSPN